MLAAANKVGLSRLSINIRDYAKKAGLLKEYSNELAKQRTLRNRKTNSPKKQAIIQWSLDGNFVNEFESLTAAAKSLGKSSGSISNALNPIKSQKSAYGYVWTFK